MNTTQLPNPPALVKIHTEVTATKAYLEGTYVGPPSKRTMLIANRPMRALDILCKLVNTKCRKCPLYGRWSSHGDIGKDTTCFTPGTIIGSKFDSLYKLGYLIHDLEVLIGTTPLEYTLTTYPINIDYRDIPNNTHTEGSVWYLNDDRALRLLSRGRLGARSAWRTVDIYTHKVYIVPQTHLRYNNIHLTKLWT